MGLYFVLNQHNMLRVSLFARNGINRVVVDQNHFVLLSFDFDVDVCTVVLGGGVVLLEPLRGMAALKDRYCGQLVTSLKPTS